MVSGIERSQKPLMFHKMQDVNLEEYACTDRNEQEITDIKARQRSIKDKNLARGKYNRLLVSVRDVGVGQGTFWLRVVML